MLRVSLLLARDLVAARIPVALARDLYLDVEARRLAQDISAHVFELRENPSTLSWAYGRRYVRTRERLRDRLWFYFHLAFTPGVSDWRVLSVPATFEFVYYMLRPMRLVWHYSVKTLRSVRPSSLKSRPVSRR